MNPSMLFIKYDNGKCNLIAIDAQPSFGIAVGAAYVAIPTGISTAVRFFAAPAAVGILGLSVTAAAISIAIAAGEIGGLKKLRRYKEVKRMEIYTM